MTDSPDRRTENINKHWISNESLAVNKWFTCTSHMRAVSGESSLKSDAFCVWVWLCAADTVSYNLMETMMMMSTAFELLHCCRSRSTYPSTQDLLQVQVWMDARSWMPSRILSAQTSMTQIKTNENSIRRRKILIACTRHTVLGWSRLGMLRHRMEQCFVCFIACDGFSAAVCSSAHINRMRHNSHSIRKRHKSG